MKKLLRFSICLMLLNITSNSFQVLALSKPGTNIYEHERQATKPDKFSPEVAADYIRSLLQTGVLNKPGNESLRHSLIRLLEQYNEPYDTIRGRLNEFGQSLPFFEPYTVLRSDTLPVRWLNQNSFIVDTAALLRNPLIIQQTIVYRAVDPSTLSYLAPMANIELLLSTLLQATDTITDTIIDERYLESRKIILHRVENGRIAPPLVKPGSAKTARFMADGSAIIVSEPEQFYRAAQPGLFLFATSPGMPDSLTMAVNTILDYTLLRDSLPLIISNIDGKQTEFWLSAGKNDPERFWAKNSRHDSVTIWVGNPSKYEISLLLEDDVIIDRLARRDVDQFFPSPELPARELARRTLLAEIPVYWDIAFENSISLNQNYLSNWARGGTGSISGMLDILARARYTNPKQRLQWTNSGRIRYGAIRTKERGTRTNADLLELNSQFNTRLMEKIDFSSVFHFRTQVAKGFRSPTDNVVISRFLNPGTFTIGTGIEFKPDANTQINFSPLSYRNTFVLDTAEINPTLHGIEAGKSSRQEMGGQLLIRSRARLMEGMNLSNSVRLFSSYLNKPENIDVDWEMSLEQQLTWLLSVRLNVHMIYDDDVRFPVLDDTGQPVLLPDGNQKRVPQPQLNQFIGLTFSVRL
ncbi:MAG TPA: DUF3078 domain-containing protein [Bacteroidales bacterium]|nr:DUF3078 domain-containing protein [Bacteroidales bacterium]